MKKEHTVVTYVVYYGVKDIKKRRSQRFVSLPGAMREFAERQAENVWVDVFKETQVTTTEKLT